MSLTLYEIPISHNCTKVRAVLRRKGLVWKSVPVRPENRREVRKVSGQDLVPALRDGEKVISDSTRILLHLEERYPAPALLPPDPAARAECLLLEDWADQAFMALTRRLAYWQILQRPGALERAWRLPGRGLRRWLVGKVGRRVVRKRFGLSAQQNRADEMEARRAAALAVGRLGGRGVLVGTSVTLADIALASMAAPLWAAAPALTSEPAIAHLLAWVPAILAPEDVALYRRGALDRS